MKYKIKMKLKHVKNNFLMWKYNNKLIISGQPNTKKNFIRQI